jgi:hypothetical protein
MPFEERFWYLILAPSSSDPKIPIRFVEVGPFSTTHLRDASNGNLRALSIIQRNEKYPRGFVIDWNRVKVKPLKDYPEISVYLNTKGYPLDNIFVNGDYFGTGDNSLKELDPERGKYEKVHPDVLKKSGAFDGGKRRTKKTGKSRKSRKSRTSRKPKRRRTYKSNR